MENMHVITRSLKKKYISMTGMSLNITKIEMIPKFLFEVRNAEIGERIEDFTWKPN